MVWAADAVVSIAAKKKSSSSSIINSSVKISVFSKKRERIS